MLNSRFDAPWTPFLYNARPGFFVGIKERRRWRFRATVFLLSAIVGVALGEVVVRLAIGPPGRMLFGFGRPFHDVQTDWDIVYRENDQGGRISCSKNRDSDDLPRIAVIGDSFVFGQGVKDCADFVSQLGDAIPSYRFHNFGLIGAGIQEYTQVARDLLEGFDGVLLVFYGNDIGRLEWDDRLPARTSQYSSLVALTRKAYRAVIVRRAYNAWRSRTEGKGEGEGSSNIALLDGRPNNILSMLKSRPDYFHSMVQPGPRYVAAFENRFAALASLLERQVGRENVFVTMVPQEHTVSKTLRRFVVDHGGAVAPFGEPGAAYGLVRSSSQRYGFRFIDVFPDFLKDGDTLYYPHDLHWTASGHQRMTEVLARFLSTEGLRP